MTDDKGIGKSYLHVLRFRNESFLIIKCTANAKLIIFNQ